jgi:hypothetical protein
MSQDLTTTILQAEQRRCAAMLANDTAALEAVLDADLAFAHATGAVDDKAAYMAKLAAGKIGYLAIRWPETRVTPLGQGHALLTGRMATQVRVDGVEKDLDNRVTTVWREADGNWHLLAFQSTPIKA